jgi:hypothetical protein
LSRRWRHLQRESFAVGGGGSIRNMTGPPDVIEGTIVRPPRCGPRHGPDSNGVGLAARPSWSVVLGVPDRCSGARCVKGTRVMVKGIPDNAAEFSAEQIASEIYKLPVDVVRWILGSIA